MENSTRTALVTGANKGIGFEVARQLAQGGMRVLLAARDRARGEQAAEQLRRVGQVEFLPLDVTSGESIQAAAAEVEKRHGALDVLINNAGIAREQNGATTATLPALRETFETNLFGVVLVTQAFLPLLRKGQAAHIIHVSSGLGSIAQHQPGGVYHEIGPAAYSASKAALNMYGVLLANELQAEGIRVSIADPGYTATDLNGHSGPQTIEEGSEAIVKLATGQIDAPTGAFLDRHGPLPW